MKVVRPYLDTPIKKKFPVGKVSGVDSHTYNGSHVMHVLVEHLEQDKKGNATKTWRLACRPSKIGVYSYMGFRRAITCTTCKSARISGRDSDADSSVASLGGAA